MKFHSDLKYNDIANADKIIVTEDMLKQIRQYFILNLTQNYMEYSFKTLNIELLSNEKINIYIENYDEEHATITFFASEEKLVSFVIEYVLDIGFDVEYILEYDKIIKYNKNAEEIILFVLKWFPMILFYVQTHSGGYDNKLKKCTFFINTKNSRLEV